MADDFLVRLKQAHARWIASTDGAPGEREWHPLTSRMALDRLMRENASEIIALLEAAKQVIEAWPPTLHEPTNLRDALINLDNYEPEN